MDRDLAARLARYSELAYEGPAAVRAALPAAEVRFLDRDHTQAYVIETGTETGTETVVAFRGTQVFADPSLADMLSNLWFRRVPWDPGRVHRGYREALLDIVQELKRPLYSGRRPLYFTGHSMGGALATLASTLPPGPSATYSFGAPRVGDRAFARALANLVRVVHGADIAPRYPLPLGYRHGGEVWHLSRAGTLTPGLPPGWDLRLPLTPAGLARALLDHRAGEYARKLALAATRGR
ncbi:MAG: lipase family protein [Kiloniellales bacterium]